MKQPFNLFKEKMSRFFHKLSNTQGVAAVEFALVLPLMVLMYLGSFEVSQSVIANKRIANVANTIGDIIAQEPSWTNGDMDAVFQAGNAILHPMKVTNLDMTVTFIKINASSQITAVWTKKGNYSPATAGVMPTNNIPPYLIIADTTLVYAEAKMKYNSVSYFVVKKDQDMSAFNFFRPRQVGDIKVISAATPPAILF